MSIINDAKEIFDSIWRRVTGRVMLSSVLNIEERIEKWLKIYRGTPSWLEYEYMAPAGYKMTRRRKSLHMAKYVCREIASLVWSENPVIDGGKESVLSEWLEAQNFFNRSQKYTEYGAAAGGFAMKLRAPDSGGLDLDFVPADYFIPVSWDNKGIYEADFLSRKVTDKKAILECEQHRRISSTQYEITVVTWEEEGAVLKNEKRSAPVPINTTVPLFAYVPTPDVNNFDIDSCLGVSIYGNALDTLESVDIAFDALSHEIILGKRRIIVPTSALRTVIDPKTGKDVRYYDPSDEAVIAFNMKDAENQKIVDNTVELRIDDLVKAVSINLDILAMQCGFSAGSFSFDGQVVKTATEVISENAKSFKTKQSFENQLTTGMMRIFEALHEIGERYGLGGVPEDVAISWNDSIIEDRNARSKYWQDRYMNGTCTLEDVLINIDGLTEEDAKTKADAIKSGKATVSVDNLFNGGK